MEEKKVQERKQVRAVYFDLDTNEMKNHLTSVPLGYACIKRSFQKHGFSHRQGSGYISNVPITNTDATRAIIEVVKENTWLCDCVRNIDVMIAGRNYAFASFVRNMKEDVAKQTLAEKKAAKENELQAKLEMSTGKSIETLQKERAELQHSVSKSKDIEHDR